MAPILETRRLTKRFRDLTAVDGLDLSIRTGACFGLLGPNGAGKTTTLEMIEGILPPTSGEVLFHGAPLGRDFKEKVGIQFQSTALPDHLRVGEVLTLFSAFYRRRADLADVRRLCDLDELWGRDAATLSGGQRQRLLLALALVNEPELVFLDEPTTGLDPHARRRFWELVRAVRARGATVVLTTHYMEEAYELCDEVAIMDRGRIIAQGAPDALLRERFKGLSIHIPKGEGEGAARPPWGPGEGPGCQVFERADGWELLTEDPEATLRALLDRAVPLQGVHIRRRNLEDLFLELTGRGFEA